MVVHKVAICTDLINNTHNAISKKHIYFKVHYDDAGQETGDSSGTYIYEFIIFFLQNKKLTKKTTIFTQRN